MPSKRKPNKLERWLLSLYPNPCREGLFTIRRAARAGTIKAAWVKATKNERRTIVERVGGYTVPKRWQCSTCSPEENCMLSVPWERIQIPRAVLNSYRGFRGK